MMLEERVDVDCNFRFYVDLELSNFIREKDRDKFIEKVVEKPAEIGTYKVVSQTIGLYDRDGCISIDFYPVEGVTVKDAQKELVKRLYAYQIIIEKIEAIYNDIEGLK